MSDTDTVIVPPEIEAEEDFTFVGPMDKETAVKLLDAAVAVGLPPEVVRTSPTEGGFKVPAIVAERAYPEADADTDPDYDRAYDESIDYADLDPSEKAKRTRRANEQQAEADAAKAAADDADANKQ